MATVQTYTHTQEDFRRRAASLRPETRMVIGGKLVDCEIRQTIRDNQSGKW